MKTTGIAALLIVLLAFPVSAALKLNDPAPAFSLPNGEGKELSLSDIVDSRPGQRSRGVILTFFASWCAPCRNELPLIDSLTDELNEKGITAVIVGYKEDFGQINDLLKELKVAKPLVLSDRYGKAGEAYGVRFLPMTFFIGADGKVKDLIYGEIKDKAELRSSAEKLLH